MFDIGWGELVVIGIVALIAIGPKELPSVLRTIGQWMGKVRRMASDFQSQFQEAMREAEIADLKKQFDEASNAASNLTSGLDNPLETARKEVEGALADKPSATAASGAESGASGTTAVELPQPEPASQPTGSDSLPGATKPAEPKREGGGSA